MINGWGKLALIHGGISSIFVYILAFGEPNMFTFPLAMVFVMATGYCVAQWLVNRTIKKLEASHPDKK